MERRAQPNAPQVPAQQRLSLRVVPGATIDRLAFSLQRKIYLWIVVVLRYVP
ncbi:MAG TPA: hypothetical protein V6D10_07355 [Trichocoleus sp.]